MLLDGALVARAEETKYFMGKYSVPGLQTAATPWHPTLMPVLICFL